MSIGLLTSQNFTFAEGICSTEVRANDAYAEASVDGGPGRAVPVEIKCQAKPQVVRVISSDKQVFTRVIPAKGEFSVSDRLWNVHFTPQANVSKSNGGVPAPAPMMAQDSYQAQILKELVEIRRLFQGLLTVRPELASQARASMAKVSRGISSDIAPMSKMEMKRSEGVYIQLHSLSRKNINRSRLESSVEGQSQEFSGSKLVLCAWRSNSDSPLWTRVLVGPFTDLSFAKKTARAVNEKAFVVKDPECLAQPADQAGF